MSTPEGQPAHNDRADEGAERAPAGCLRLERCPCCGRAPLVMVWVHSHEQTACCGAVLGPCCQP